MLNERKNVIGTLEFAWRHGIKASTISTLRMVLKIPNLSELYNAGLLSIRRVF
jgi:hypothetical protein